MAATPTRSASGTQGQDPRLSTLRGMLKPAAGGHPAPRAASLKGDNCQLVDSKIPGIWKRSSCSGSLGPRPSAPSPEPRSLTQPVGPAERFQDGSKLSQPALQKETHLKPYELGFSSPLQICLFLGPGSWLGLEIEMHSLSKYSLSTTYGPGLGEALHLPPPQCIWQTEQTDPARQALCPHVGGREDAQGE